MTEHSQNTSVRLEPSRRVRRIVTACSLAYVISLSFPWDVDLAFGGSYGIVVLLFLLGGGVFQVLYAGSLGEGLFWTGCCLAVLWPLVYWYLVTCWILLERQGACWNARLNRLLVWASLAAAAIAIVIDFVSTGVRVDIPFVVASCLPLLTSILLWLQEEKADMAT